MLHLGDQTFAALQEGTVGLFLTDQQIVTVLPHNLKVRLLLQNENYATKVETI